MTYEYDIAIPGGGPSLTTGERRLMLAILEDAMRTLLGHRYGSRHARLQREDLDWLMSDDMDDPFTYLRICDALGIDADWLRRRILTARAELEDSAPRLVVVRVDDPEDAYAPLQARGGGR